LVGEVILMAIDKTIIVLGEGDLFFSPFEPGTTQGDGEEYFGNTTDISISRDVSKLDRFTSYGGQQISLSPIILRESASLDITTDHLAMSNVARWFGMISEDSDVLAGAGTYFESFTARLGRFYQLGQTVTPQGVRAIENVQVSVGGTAVDPATNFEVDNASGRIQILKECRIHHGRPDISSPASSGARSLEAWSHQGLSRFSAPYASCRPIGLDRTRTTSSHAWR
jgi:hypothetical protein